MALLYIFRFRYNYLRARIMSAVQLQEAPLPAIHPFDCGTCPGERKGLLYLEEETISMDQSLVHYH